MPIEDAHRWNSRYSSDLRESFEHPRPFLVENSNLLPQNGLALDIAMGLGGNSGFLIQHGLSVIGVDISLVAMRKAYTRLPSLFPVVADLNDFYIPPASFDVITNFLYLQRNLWPVITDALRPGGILFYESLTLEMLAIHPEIEMRFLLQPGELAQAFPRLKTLIYREGWQKGYSRHPRAVASLIARA
jgi:SAM-dependent methyltransferase